MDISAYMNTNGSFSRMGQTNLSSNTFQFDGTQNEQERAIKYFNQLQFEAI